MWIVVQDMTHNGSHSEADFLAGCSSLQQRRVASVTTQIDVDPGRVLSHECGSDHQFVIIVSGEATVSVDGANAVRLGPGCGFGAVFLPTLDGPRRARVTAATHMRLLVLAGAEFRALVMDFPTVVERVQRATADRLASVGSCDGVPGVTRVTHWLRCPTRVARVR